MAIDGEKLVRRMEDRFGVSISHEEVERIETIGHLCDHLTKRAKEMRRRPSVTAWMFYRLRRTLLAQLPLERGQIRPQALLRDLIPGRARKRVWRRLQAEFGYRLPDLQASPTMRKGLLGFAVVSLIALLGIVIGGEAYGYLMVLPFIWAMLLGLALLFTKPFARHVPPPIETVGDLVRHLVPFRQLLPEVADAGIDAWVFDEVRAEVAQTAGVEAGKLSRKTHFIRDLGVK